MNASMPSGHQPAPAVLVSWVRAYFYSGWGFLVPYLFVYLLYAGLGWPVHSSGHVPSLLTVYWGLHVFHTLGAALALWSWWRIPNQGRFTARLWPAIPWVLLGMFLLLPGIYWEYPGDNWAHFGRINAWAQFDTVRGNSDWAKSSYFLAYSFNRLSPHNASSLELYYAGASLLLCWQYRQLARGAGLRPAAAFLMAVLPVIFAGNSTFSFHRYYGISSTVLAQLAAVAFVRVCANAAPTPGRPGWRFARATQAGLLLLLMAFEHKQAVALAGVGLAAVALWRLQEWRPAATLWAMGMALGSSVLVAAWQGPQSESIASLRAGGWLSAVGGFNLAPGSIAYAQAMQVLGWFGLANVIAGLFLLRKNHLAGWLTVTPVAAVVLPVTGMPLAEYLFHLSPLHVPVFSRLFFAIPTGFALVAWLDLKTSGKGTLNQSTHPAGAFMWPVALALLLVLPADAPSFNRFWHAVAVPPADLTLREIPPEFSTPAVERLRAQSGWFMTRPAAGVVAMASGQPIVLIHGQRLIQYPDLVPPAVFAARDQAELSADRSRPLLVFIPAPELIHSPLSLAACLSEHWLAQEVALNLAGEREAKRQATSLSVQSQVVRPAGTYYLLGPR